MVVAICHWHAEHGWRINHEMNRQMSQLTSKWDIVMCLMELERKELLPLCWLWQHTPLNSNIYFDGVNNIITHRLASNQNVNFVKEEKENTLLWCKKCKLMLCKIALFHFIQKCKRKKEIKQVRKFTCSVFYRLVKMSGEWIMYRAPIDCSFITIKNIALYAKRNRNGEFSPHV